MKERFVEYSLSVHLCTMKFFALVFTFLFASLSYGQDAVRVLVQIKDARSGEAVPNVDVRIEGGGYDSTYITGSSGKILYIGQAGEEYTFTLRHQRYLDTQGKKRIPGKISNQDTVRYMFEMDFIRTQDVETMWVVAPGVPTQVFGSERLHVNDFEILANGDILLLTYPKQLKKGSQLILYDGRDIRANIDVEEVAEELVHDFRGNPHLICENDVIGVVATDKKIGLARVEREYFTNYVMPILDTNKAKLYFSNFNSLYPAFDYFSFDRVDSAYRKISEIKDELMMELYRSEYKWVDVRTKLWAKQKEYDTGIDAEIWVGMQYFTQSIYYKELYAPLFHRNDSLFVFDYYKDRLRIYDDLGDPLDSIPIYHHYDKRHTGWASQLVQDRKTGQIYALYDRAGYQYIGWVDTKTGEINQHVRLEHRYAQQIQVYNNEIYYVYRPFESAQKKYLYKQRLPYDFGAATTLKGDVVED